MTPPRRATPDARTVEQVVGRLLQLGVMAAAAVVAIGAARLLLAEGGRHVDFRVFAGPPALLRSVAGTVRATLDGSPRGTIQLGLLLLIATPIARVAATLVAFLLERDRLYVAITSLVLALLLLGLLTGA